ncbi:MAG: hypothetical protein IJ343_03130 [Clostridia bacterium]|nr:hypothetical protein [Clostridia bacterium]
MILAVLLVIALGAAGYLGWRNAELSGQLEDMTKQLSVTADALVAKTTEQEETAAKLADTETALAAKTAEQEETAAKLTDTETALTAKTAEQEETAAKLADTETALAAKNAEQEVTAAKLTDTETALAAKTAEQEATAAKLADTKSALAAKTGEQETTATLLANTKSALAAKTAEQEATAAKLRKTEASLAATTAELEATAFELAAVQDEFQQANAALAETSAKLEAAEAALTQEALAALSVAIDALTGYDPSDGIEEPVIEEPVVEETVPVLTGDLLTLGHYEQDNDLSTSEPLQWRVLKVEGNKAFVVSEYVLEGRVYHGRKEDVNWATCDLRTWLNGWFLNAAFTQEEQQAILATQVDTPVHPDYPIKGFFRVRSMDKVFLLSYQEIMELMPTRNDRLAYATEWAGITASVARLADGKPWWWLRTTGASLQNACYISNGGEGVIKEGPVNQMNTLYGTTGGVRPAMWIDLNKLGK